MLAQQPDSDNTCLLFEISNVMFSVDTGDIDSIIEPPTITAMPVMPDYVLGSFSYRGHAASAIQTCRLLRLAPNGRKVRSAFVASKIGSDILAFEVDKVIGIVPRSETQQSQDFFSQAGVIVHHVEGRGLAVHINFTQLIQHSDQFALQEWHTRLAEAGLVNPIEAEDLEPEATCESEDFVYDHSSSTADVDQSPSFGEQSASEQALLVKGESTDPGIEIVEKPEQVEAEDNAKVKEASEFSEFDELSESASSPLDNANVINVSVETMTSAPAKVEPKSPIASEDWVHFDDKEQPRAKMVSNELSLNDAVVDEEMVDKPRPFKETALPLEPRKIFSSNRHGWAVYAVAVLMTVLLVVATYGWFFAKNRTEGALYTTVSPPLISATESLVDQDNDHVGLSRTHPTAKTNDPGVARRIVAIATPEFSITVDRPEGSPKLLENEALSIDLREDSVGREKLMLVEKRHTVVEGDTLWAIAQSFLENPFRYPELAKASGIRDPNLIFPGDIVTISRFSE